MNAASVWAVVPVKRFAVAKRRLAPLLGGAERAELARLMLEDVLEALAAARMLSGTIVVTDDDTARRAARSRGAVGLADPGPDLNAAVAAGREFLARQHHGGMIVVLGDIPLLDPALVNELAGYVRHPAAVALVPASRDRGTNLLACSPVDAIEPCFGPDSFRRHCAAARRAGIVPTVRASPEAGLDIDRPEDVAAFLAVPSTARSRAFLAALGGAARFRRGTARHDSPSTVEA